MEPDIHLYSDDERPPVSLDDLLDRYPLPVFEETPISELEGEALTRKQGVLAPMPDTPRNRGYNDVLRKQRLSLPLCPEVVAEILDEIKGNRKNRERRQRLEALQSRDNIKRYSQRRLERALEEIPVSHDIDDEAVVRAMADESITFTRDDRNRVSIEWETEEITLSHGEHSQNLGRFNVSFQLGGHQVRAIALSPNTASGNDHVPHPHVSNEYMCLGEAENTIPRAGRQGRIGMIKRTVDAILNTYNPGSPFVPLERWDAVQCRNCGGYINDDPVYCQQCSRIGCSGCLVWSQRYNCYVCRGCRASCHCCDTYFPSEQRTIPVGGANHRRRYCNLCFGPAAENPPQLVTRGADSPSPNIEEEDTPVYDEDGYDSDGYDSDGYDSDGFDRDGISR